MKVSRPGLARTVNTLHHQTVLMPIICPRRGQVERIDGGGAICILDIDVQGVKQVKESELTPHLVFIRPPSMGELERRLRCAPCSHDA